MAGERTVQFLIDRGRLESFEASDLATLADALTRRASLRLEGTLVFPALSTACTA